MNEKPSTNLSGTVEKIIKSVNPAEPEKAQIAVEQADHLYKEIRIENTLTDADGNPVRLKPGCPVDVVIEANPEDTIKKQD
jgi:predicted DNA-binding antitoxin AbrB/MazE fold protein